MKAQGTLSAIPIRRDLAQILSLSALLAVLLIASSRPGEGDAGALAVRAEATPRLSAINTELLEATQGERSLLRTEGHAARLINASLPFSPLRPEVAAPFELSGGVEDEERALHCLTQAVYYEAGAEPVEGRRAVAQVVLNRVRHPAFPKSVCGVVHQGSARPGCQFSFTCDGSLGRQPAAGGWREAQRIARWALAGNVVPSVGHATHFHADYVAPYWAPRLSKIRQVGTHIFYRWPGAWGLRQAFTGRYAGNEFAPQTLAISANKVEAQGPTEVKPPLPPERHAENDVGGRLDVTKGWTLSIPDPEELGSAFASVAQRQTNELTTKAVSALPTPAAGVDS